MTEKIVNVEEAERTLRMVAELAAPEGLAARVKTHLAAVQVEAGERNSAGKPGQLLAWPVRLRRVDWLRSAAAAMLLAAVAGGGWSAYRWVAPASRVQTAPGWLGWSYAHTEDFGRTGGSVGCCGQAGEEVGNAPREGPKGAVT